ncbi:MAG: hypothetical protein HPAVJP_1140 [Candidatus Hepatoplasma vulgare]|nr:MAG: hypothetical protein HPAVJP_1140 [Candidatus Hepatoplasma sp.]
MEDIDYKQENKINLNWFNKLRWIIYQIISADRHHWFSFIYDVLIAIIAVFSIIPFVTDTNTNFVNELDNLHWVFIGIFIFDYFLRWSIADYEIKKGSKSFIFYPFTIWAIIDFFAIIPSFFGVEVLQALLSLRLLRLVRISSLMENGFKFVFKSIFTYWRVLLLVFLSFIVIIFIGGCFIYISEYGENPSINNYWDAIWYVFVMITTIGFGDVIVVTSLGRIFSVIFYLVGLCYLALVIATVVAGFQRQIENLRNSIATGELKRKRKFHLKILEDGGYFDKNKNSLSKKEHYYHLKEEFEISHDYILLYKSEERKRNFKKKYSNKKDLKKTKNDSNSKN